MTQLGKLLITTLTAVLAFPLSAQNTANQPTWWAKYDYLSRHGASSGQASNSIIAGSNTDASAECGPQSETYIAVNGSAPNQLAGGSNEIFRDPMRAYSSSNSGATWVGSDLPLPPARGTNGVRFGSDPSLVFDSRGNVFYSYIVVFFGSGKGINGTELAVARSTDGGQTFPGGQASYFSFSGGSDHFNDKPMITADTNATSPYRDNIYVAWDAASGGSTGGGVLLARSADHGATFAITRLDNAGGPGRAIGAVPFVGPNGEVYVAWNDFAGNTIAFTKSLDGGSTWAVPVTIAPKQIAFEIAIPAEFSRKALVYPSCDADRSNSRRRGTLYCSWIDLRGSTTDVLVSISRDGGLTWSAPAPVADQLGRPVDRFNHWLAVDGVTGDVNLAFYDTRNDTTGSRYMTDIYFTSLRAKSTIWLSPNVRVSTASSNEHDCDGVYPCSAINYGNQYGDYAGLASYGGVSYPIWTDSRNNRSAAPSCSVGLMEEIFTARVQ